LSFQAVKDADLLKLRMCFGGAKLIKKRMSFVIDNQRLFFFSREFDRNSTQNFIL